ncbi:peptide-methionine (R)-S-oxide reductase MsrB [Oleisolibacter albus]|uniref:peptide-methionine (R)-S-oxide reductase MsrB n=1 Tax=Oleisolibacter albus TaxID=2171757 RepID=UPI000DF2E035|nr:peptide-methionine (R)-S-oxide reductase MsrB [Oleisolibacter albus]
MTKRGFLGALLAGGAALSSSQAGAAGEESFPFRLSDAEWRQRLSPAAYAVLRQHETERAGSSPLDREKRPGRFHCAGCDHPLFDAASKYDSGTGWPSFWQPLPGGVGTRSDRSFFFMPRTEVHCANCGGHLGHVFEDGPPPTGLRYCMNGVAMTFVSAAG